MRIHLPACCPARFVARFPAGFQVRLLACLLAAMVATLPVAGCSGGPETVITGQVTVTFWHGQKGAGAELLDRLAAEFKTLEPNIVVTPVYRGDAAAVARDLEAAVSSGQGPVLAEVPDQSLPALRASGVLRPLQAFITSRHYGLELADLEDFWSCFVKADTVGRQAWGLPFSHKVYALVYDPDLVPEVPETLEELMETAQSLTRRNPDPAQSTFGLAFRPDADLFCLFVQLFGGTLVAGDPPRYVFNSREGMAALEYLYEVTALRKAALLTVGHPVEAVVHGHAAMAIGPVGWPADGSPDPAPALAPLPAGQAPAGLTPGTSLVMAVGHTPAEEEAAWRFMRWLTSPEVAARWSAVTGDIPVRRSAMDQPAWRLGPGSRPGFREVMASLDAAVVPPDLPNWPKVRSDLSAAVSRYLLGEVGSSQAVLDGVVRAANQTASSP